MERISTFDYILWCVSTYFSSDVYNLRLLQYYYDTASGHKFNSKAEVSRYLNTSQISDEVKQKVEETLKRSANDVRWHKLLFIIYI